MSMPLDSTMSTELVCPDVLVMKNALSVTIVVAPADMNARPSWWSEAT